jgi:hypothetical protein
VKTLPNGTRKGQTERIAHRERTVTREQASLMALDDAIGFRNMSLAPDCDPNMRRTYRNMMRAAASEWRTPTYLPPLVWR